MIQQIPKLLVSYQNVNFDTEARFRIIEVKSDNLGIQIAHQFAEIARHIFEKKDDYNELKNLFGSVIVNGTLLS